MVSTGGSLYGTYDTAGDDATCVTFGEGDADGVEGTAADESTLWLAGDPLGAAVEEQAAKSIPMRPDARPTVGGRQESVGDTFMVMWLPACSTFRSPHEGGALESRCQ
jgi:hypothetical protein